MQLGANDYMENPTSLLYFKKNSKKVRDTLKDLDHKNALADY